MKQLPDRPNLDHLRAQAKSLCRAVRQDDPAAVERVRESAPHLPLGPTFKLHDAQSCLAREYGFTSWLALKRAAEAKVSLSLPADQARAAFAVLAIGHSFSRARPADAARFYEQVPRTIDSDPWLACTVGHLSTVERALQAAGWVNQPGGPFSAPPLVMATHSSLAAQDGYKPKILEVVRLLLSAGADPNGSYVESSSPDWPLSALFGAAGRVHDADVTRILLEAGANPNDNESLYHSCETRDLACTRLLLEAGARVSGTNSVFHTLDFDDLDRLRLLLQHGGDPNERLGEHTSISWAIYRRRSPAHVQALLDAGADPNPDQAKEPYYAMALRHGLPDVAALFGPSALQPIEAFVARCASGDLAGARHLLAESPGLLGQLSPHDQRLLPDLAQAGDLPAVRALVTMGWPLAARGGDWDATALNLAVFRGDVPMTRFLLENGASWTESHGYGDNVAGTLSFASRFMPVPDGDYLGCAQALVEHGLPVDFETDYTWGEAVRDWFDEVKLERSR